MEEPEITIVEGLMIEALPLACAHAATLGYSAATPNTAQHIQDSDDTAGCPMSSAGPLHAGPIEATGSAPLSSYELQRAAKIQQNRGVLRQLGVNRLPSAKRSKRCSQQPHTCFLLYKKCKSSE